MILCDFFFEKVNVNFLDFLNLEICSFYFILIGSKKRLIDKIGKYLRCFKSGLNIICLLKKKKKKIQIQIKGEYETRAMIHCLHDFIL
jgi:hypothetical protein